MVYWQVWWIQIYLFNIGCWGPLHYYPHKLFYDGNLKCHYSMESDCHLKTVLLNLAWFVVLCREVTLGRYYGKAESVLLVLIQHFGWLPWRDHVTELEGQKVNRMHRIFVFQCIHILVCGWLLWKWLSVQQGYFLISASAGWVFISCQSIFALHSCTQECTLKP